MLLAPLICLGACKVLPPPPVVPMHASTAADPKGETTVMIVVGAVSQVLGGDGFGLALRVEHQQTDRTLLGAEISGGRGDGDSQRLWMLAVRGYGRGTPRTHDWVAVQYGAGAAFLNTGMVALQLHGGAAISYPNSYFIPYLSSGLALSVPVREGDAFGDMDQTAMIEPGHAFGASEANGVHTNLYFTLDPGFVVPLGDTGHALSLDVGLATGMMRKGGFVSLSIADRFAP